MKRAHATFHRILAISPGTRGFGYAVLEGHDTLVDWGVKSVTGQKNARCLVKVKEMITRYQPDVVVLENTLTKDSRRSPRIRALTKSIVALASKRNVKPELVSCSQMKRVLFVDSGEWKKHDIAENVAKRFPEELSLRLPPKRRPWMSEDSRMGIFDAVALALTLQSHKTK
jgi:Holliday junction resolvasome RuvABC endonuclease subunit